jgi:hypothetical protein
MTKYVAFLRGINVVGKNIIKVEALKDAFQSMGLKKNSVLARPPVIGIPSLKYLLNCDCPGHHCAMYYTVIFKCSFCIKGK